MEQEKLNEMFLTAASRGNIDEAVEALSNGADLNSKSLKGNNALYLSATRNKYDFFEWLLEVTQKGVGIDLNNKNNTQNTLLLELVIENVAPVFIEKLLDKGAEVDMLSRDGITPLLQACANVNLEVSKILLEKNADPNKFTEGNKTTPFLMSIVEGNFEVVKLLEQFGANINEVDKFGRNALISALFRPTTYMRKHEKEAHNELLEYLVNSDIDLDYVAPSGVTAIWLASLMGKNSLVKTLIEKGVSVDRWHQLSPSDGKHAVIHTLCRIGDPEMVSLALDNGAKLSVKNEEGNSAEAYGFMVPALRQIMLDHNADVNAELFIKSSDPNKKVIGVPLMSQIVSEGDSSYDLIEEMVKRGAHVTSQSKAQDKFDPILMTITSCAPRCVELFLSQPGININKQINFNPEGAKAHSISYLGIACSDLSSDKLGGALQKKNYLESLLAAKKENEKNGVVSPLIDQSSFDKIEEVVNKLQGMEDSILVSKKKIFDLIIKHGADIEQVNEDGKTALFYCKDVQTIKWLEEKGVNIFHKDNKGNNPLINAILNANFELIDYYKGQYSKTQNLDNMYYRMSFIEVEGFKERSMLESGLTHFAGGEKLFELLKPKKDEEFIPQNIDNINYQDEDGNTPLIVACANDIPTLVSLYHRLGADVNLPNNEGETPIMHAIASRNTAMIEYLVKVGANCAAKTNEGKSVLDFAIETDSLSILKVINTKKENKKPKP